MAGHKFSFGGKKISVRGMTVPAAGKCKDMDFVKSVVKKGLLPRSQVRQWPPALACGRKRRAVVGRPVRELTGCATVERCGPHNDDHATSAQLQGAVHAGGGRYKRRRIAHGLGSAADVVVEWL
ncbi:unnamed protein product [Lampetra planeri]